MANLRPSGAAMKTAARILWVDDAIDKRGAAPGAILGLMQRTNGVKAFGCHPWSLASKIGGTPGYDLFLVDFRLSKEPYQNRGRYPYTGISVGGLIRDECPEYPIYLTSALLTEQSDIVLDSELFDRVVTLQSLTTRPGIELLKNDALDYHKIRNAKPRGSIRSVHRLLRSPTSTHTEIVQALPEELRHGL